MAWLTGWSKRQSITVNSNGVGLSGNLTDFAIAVNVPSANTAFWAGVKTDGTDVRFTSADGTTLLKFEIESFDNTGDDAWYHVKVPTVDATTDTVIYLYYVNAGATSGEDINNTWESGFLGVYHLNQDKAAGAFDDSTVNGNDGTNGTTTDGLGQVDRCRVFDGTYDGTLKGIAVNSVIPDDPTLFTLSMWAKESAGSSVLFGHRSEATRLIQLTAASSSEIRFQMRSSGNSLKAVAQTGLTVSNWNHYVITFDKAGNSFKLYCNGALSGTDVTNFGSETFTSTYTTLGQYYTGTVWSTNLNGSEDEVKFSNIVRSADWVIAEYQSGIGTWLTFGTEEANSYEYVGVGGGIAGGSATTLQAMLYSGTGGGISGGIATFAQAMTYSANGGGVAGGEAAFTYNGGGSFVMVMDGGGVAGGTADFLQAMGFLSSGGGIGGGTAAYSFTTSSFVIPIETTIRNADNTPLTGGGGSTSLKIKEAFTNHLLDWNDLIFKASGWTTLSKVMNEIDAVNYAGRYKQEVDVALWSDGWYLFSFEYTSSPYQGGDMELLVMSGQPVSYRVGTNADSLISSRLAAASYTAPDNAGIAALPLLSEIEASIVLAKQAKLDFVEKWILNKLVENLGGTTVTLYDDDGVTPLKTWPYNSTTKTRSKAT